MQLVWSRCINTHGIPGKNIPSDLFMKHLNRVCKEVVLTLGSNKTLEAIKRVGKCVGAINDLLEHYDTELSLDGRSGRHSIASAEKDKSLMISALLDAQVFSLTNDRAHSCFKDIKINIVSESKHSKKITEWMKKQLQLIKNFMT